MPIRLVLADDHPIVLAGLRQLFETDPDFQVLATASNDADAIKLVRELVPDILVLDLRMPARGGLEVLREIKRNGLSTRTVVLTAVNGEDVIEAVRLGTHGVVLKDMAPKLLLSAVREVHAGGKWIEKSIAAQAIDSLLQRESVPAAGVANLTPRELEVARMAARGLSNKAIASRLAITEGTAKLHLHRVYEKLKLDGRMALLRYLQANGLE